MSEQRTRLRVRVRGRVQGVAFRFRTRERAQQEGVDGFVRNLPDGSVEAVFEGAPERVRALVDYCRRGPPSARVDSVEIAEELPESLAGFTIR